MHRQGRRVMSEPLILKDTQVVKLTQYPGEEGDTSCGGWRRRKYEPALTY